MRHVIRLFVLACCILAGLHVAPAQARRVALVIGNAAYKVGPLANPVNDAAAVAEALEKQLRFDKVILRRNLSGDAFRAALREMSREALGAEFGVIYFAGHGIEVAGRNFLIPTDAALAAANDIDLEAIALDTALAQLDGVTKLKLVILDACRNNPFTVAGARRSVSRGLARIEPEGNTLVAYAAKDGTTADDGKGGRHSPFTTALLKRIATPGLDVRRLFGYVSDDVLVATNRVQEPYLYGRLGGEEIFLRAPAGPGAAAQPSAPQPSEAALEWSRVDKTSIAELETFERRHPGSLEAEYARARLRELRKPQIALSPPPAAPAPPSAPSPKPAPTVQPPPTQLPAMTRSVSLAIQSAVPPSSPVLGPMAKTFAAEVARLTARKLTLQVLNPGSLVPAFQMLDAVSSGVLDAAWSAPNLWIGKHPAFEIAAGMVPFGLPPERLVAWIEGPGKPLIDRLYARHNVHWLPCAVHGPEGGWFRRPIDSLGDLRGLKVRWLGASARALQKFGSSPVLLPAGEIVPALERGVIDGGEFSIPSVDASLGIHQAGRYYYHPGWHAPAGLAELLLSRKAWNDLGAAGQQVLAEACRRNLRATLAANPADEARGLAALRAKGVQVKAYPPQMLQALRKAADEELAALSAQNAEFKEMLASYQSYR
jgi:TRAP-type mannitol/chloroaromatic compound transport system substrate-binding protein